MNRLRSIFVVAVLALALLTGCGKGSSSTSSGGGATTASTSTQLATSCPTDASGFAKTKFVAHAGLGFGAFHRYIYKPYRAGTFKSGAHGRIRAFLKAGLAALFIKREIRLAGVAAQKSPALCKAVLKPLHTVSETIGQAVTKLKGGDAAGITAVENAITQAKSGSSSNGTAITEPDNAPLR